MKRGAVPPHPLERTSSVLMKTRILLHLKCLALNRQAARFHLTGIVREFVPRRWQGRIR